MKGKQNQLTYAHMARAVETYRDRPKQVDRYARRVEMMEIESNDFNLNISRYVSTAQQEPEIDLAATHGELLEIENAIRKATTKHNAIRKATTKHNAFLKELGLSPLPASNPNPSRE